MVQGIRSRRQWDARINGQHLSLIEVEWIVHHRCSCLDLEVALFLEKSPRAGHFLICGEALKIFDLLEFRKKRTNTKDRDQCE